MRIRLKLYGVFRSAAKRRDLELDTMEGSTVRSLVSQLVSQEDYRSLKLLLLDSSTTDPRPNALILVSGRELSVLNGMETVLHEGDEIAILPIAHGG